MLTARTRFVRRGRTPLKSDSTQLRFAVDSPLDFSLRIETSRQTYMQRIEAMWFTFRLATDSTRAATDHDVDF